MQLGEVHDSTLLHMRLQGKRVCEKLGRYCSVSRGNLFATILSQPVLYTTDIWASDFWLYTQAWERNIHSSSMFSVRLDHLIWEDTVLIKLPGPINDTHLEWFTITDSI